MGKITQKCWREIPQHYPKFILDEYIIMPNHIHGILMVKSIVGANDYSPLQQQQRSRQNSQRGHRKQLVLLFVDIKLVLPNGRVKIQMCMWFGNVIIMNV